MPYHSKLYTDEATAKDMTELDAVARTDLPIPQKVKGGKPAPDVWADIFSRHAVGTSFLVSEQLKGRIVAAAARKDSVVRNQSEGPFRYRVWIVEKP